ncbi:SCO6745 family protein [Actinoplanes sp. NPDC049118]|uniref:SCO6745 family protein n=1 Tax=Actinoplanes sp. NPDC049118 TaxID=3155769 RepID=UPI0033FF1ABA
MAELDQRPARAVEPALARTAWRTAEPIHGMIYFAPEAHRRYAALGLRDRMGYFASRAAAFGPVGAETVIATFFNFNPALVRAAIPEAWRIAAPEDILRTRFEAADAALRRACGPDLLASPEMAEAAGLARRAAESASGHPQGRPLFAATSALPWPDEPHLVLWHAQTLLREYRGDGHVAALLLSGRSGIEALVMHAATGRVAAEVLRRTRGWSPAEWDTAVDQLRSGGLLEAGDEPALTETGLAQRQWVEDRTDLLAAPAYAVLGNAGCTRLAELAERISRAVIEAGLLKI